MLPRLGAADLSGLQEVVSWETAVLVDAHGIYVACGTRGGEQVEFRVEGKVHTRDKRPSGKGVRPFVQTSSCSLSLFHSYVELVAFLHYFQKRGCVTSGKLLTSFTFSFPNCKMRLRIESTSEHLC